MTLLEAALEYAALGWHVFPVKPRGKSPIVPGGFKSAATDEEQIKEWWTNEPEANIGIACGASGLAVLDIDSDNGGYQSLLKLQGEQYLPPTLVCRSGNGLHRYFRMADSGEELRNSASRLGAGLDIRAEGGYVVAPPSVHENGKLYEWLGQEPGNQEPAPLPEWIVEALNGPKHARNRGVEPSGANTLSGGLRSEIAPGARNATLASIGGWLRAGGLGERELMASLYAINLERCDPPLSEDEVSRIASSISMYPSRDTVRDSDVHYGRLRPISWNDPPSPPQWFLEGLIAKEDVVMVIGEPEAMKSWFTMSLAVAVARGDSEWAAIPLKVHGKVMYVDEENHPSEAFRRLLRLGFDVRGDEAGNFSYYSQENVRLDRDAQRLFLEVARQKPALVILDSLVRFHTADEQNNMAMARLYNDGIKPLSRHLGATVVVLHHTNKGDSSSSFQRARGAGDLTASIDLGLDIQIPGDGDYRIVKVFKPRHQVSYKRLYVSLRDDDELTYVERRDPFEERDKQRIF